MQVVSFKLTGFLAQLLIHQPSNIFGSFRRVVQRHRPAKITQAKSSHRNKVVLLQTNHVSNLDVPPLWLLKPEAERPDQSLYMHVGITFSLYTSTRKFLKNAVCIFYKLKWIENELWPAVQQHLTLPVVDLLVHPVTSLEERKIKGVGANFFCIKNEKACVKNLTGIKFT